MTTDTFSDLMMQRMQYFEDHPYLTRKSAEYLESAGAALVGIDSLNIDDNTDDNTDGTRPAHTILLGAEIPIVEHMCNLGSLPQPLICACRFYEIGSISNL